MELRHLRYFVAVAEELNFTRAAARLGIGQPPLSQQIRDLERELSVTLFVRRPQGAELTPAGAVFLHEARSVLEMAQHARTSAVLAQRGQIGHLRLGYASSVALHPLVSNTIRRFRGLWPEVVLAVSEGNSRELIERLHTGRADAVFVRPGPADPPGTRLLRLPGEPMRIVLPAEHPLAACSEIPLATLAMEPFILFARAVGLSLFDAIVAACREAGFEPSVVQEAPQISSVVNLVAAGLGISVVPESITQLRLHGVVYRPIRAPAPLASIGLAAAAEKPSVLVDHLFSLMDPET
ncbi:LysR substrate-binding domain-containing protein [Acetobacter fallax]|uniref:LysR family transcriptional regulator n=1 Tax=Acetobacter fallax TaxID=1737473 RepID=A0ABX0KCL2_9PROT|nr:LysR family transcriptional regulator [Acetobacter fallax]NHO36349.1 LysR family transcriptional regulator [Acetobacter fallax]